MCIQIVINKGEKEIETPGEFVAHFGFMPEMNFGHKVINPDACLCQCDVVKALDDNKIPFKKDCGYVYVGMIEDM